MYIICDDIIKIEAGKISTWTEHGVTYYQRRITVYEKNGGAMSFNVSSKERKNLWLKQTESKNDKIKKWKKKRWK